MDRASKRATYIPGQVDAEANKRNTVTERSVGKTERQRASTLLALGLAEEKEQALTEASLLSADVDDAGEIAASSYSVQILGTDLAAKKPGKAFTVYKVEITHDISTWNIYRRYSQFHALLEELKSTHGKKVAKGFPPKKFINNLSPASIDKRHQQLQDWLQSVLNNKWIVSSTALQLFIKAGKEDAEFVPRQHGSTIESDVDIAETLYKWDGSKWKGRWFVLRHGRLYKYNSKDAKHPYGFYDLRQCKATLFADLPDLTLKSPRHFMFFVDAVSANTEKQNRYIFGADSEASMKNWVATLNKESVQASSGKKVFGVSLADARDRDANGVPLFLSALLTFLEATALTQEDLFTKPPDEEIKRAIDRGKAVDLAKLTEDVHAVAALVHHYLHDLPDSLIPEDICPAFYGTFEIKDKEKRLRMLTALSEILPIINRNLLIKLFSFLHNASRGAVKRERLSKMFARLIFRVGGEHQLNLVGITGQLIDHWEALVVDEQYIPPEKVLVVKKKGKGKKGASRQNTEQQDSIKVSAPANTPAKTSSATTTATTATPPTQQFNDYCDENEEWEESSEEEEWSDEEVQVISDFDSDEGYEDDEVEYSEEGLLNDLAKQAASLPELSLVAPPAEPAPEPEPAKKKKDKRDKKDKKDKKDDGIKKKKSDSKSKLDTTGAEQSPKKKKDKSDKTSKTDKTDKQEPVEQKAQAPSRPSAPPAFSVKTSASSVPMSASTDSASAEPISDTAAVQAHSESTDDKNAQTQASEDQSPVVASPTKNNDSAPPTVEDSESSSEEYSDEDSPRASIQSTTSEPSEATAPVSAPATAATESSTTQQSTSTTQQPAASTPTATTAPTTVETSKTGAEMTSQPTPALSLSSVEHVEPEIVSPSHQPLANLARPKKPTKHAPSKAKNPNELPVSPRSAEPAPVLSPKQQLVADLTKALGRRPPGGVAMPGMPKKTATPPAE